MFRMLYVQDKKSFVDERAWILDPKAVKYLYNNVKFLQCIDLNAKTISTKTSSQLFDLVHA